MPPPSESTMPATRRVRKSVSGVSPTKTTDKENATIDMGSSASGSLASTAAASRKKSRSKSMGPGGVDALKATSGNRRMSLAAPARPPPRSILKPTMPILADIPPLKSKAKASAAAAAAAAVAASSSSAKASPASAAPGTRIALRTEEEQQAAERERAAREKQVHDHREARRKSLANRRVSFAAEATLHTFHEIEYMQDLTTSTDSTTARRASSATASAAHTAQAPFFSDASEPAAVASPLQPQRPAEDTDLLAMEDSNNQTLTSTVFDSDEEDNDNEGDDDNDDDDDNVMSDSGSDIDSDEGDGATMVTVDADESTSASVLSAISALSGRSASPIESTSDLDEALRLATQHAGAQADRARRQRPLDEDEEAIPAFGWGKKAAAPGPQQDDDNDTAMSMDMEMTTAMGGGIFRPAASTAQTPQPDNTEMQMDMTMDVTRVYGGILLPPPAQGMDTESASVASSPMILPSEPDEAEATVVSEAPMELTTAIGRIQPFSPSRDQDTESVDNDALEDMSMELTTVLGGVLGGLGADGSPLSAARRQQRTPSQPQRRLSRRLSRRQSVRGPSAGADGQQGEEDDAPMDLTVAVGAILPQEASAEGDPKADAMADITMEMDMDMTTVLGGIVLPEPSPPPAAREASPSQSAFRGTGLHRTPAKAAGAAAAAAAVKTTATAAPSTPKRASPARDMIGSRSKSPKRPVSMGKKETNARSTTPQSPPKSARGARAASAAAPSPFARNRATGASAPSVVLTPQRSQRQQAEAPPRPPLPSAFADAGPASPKITAIFNRRSSLADSAAAFVVGAVQAEERGTAGGHAGDRTGDRTGVSFAEPAGASRPGTPEQQQQQDGREVTQNLKELIDNLSPKKSKKDNPFRGRKSLHVGSAKGLLGKRPLELDGDDDDGGGGSGSSSDEATLESQAFVKRLRVGDGEPSPVKSIRLQQPPSAMETIGRSSRTRRPSFSPPASVTATALPAAPGTPRALGDDGDAADSGAADAAHGAAEDNDDATAADEHIHLTDFLNLANIHFMELETTKRRATKAPGSFQQDGYGAMDGGSGSGGGGGPRLSTDEEGRPKDPETEALVTSVCKVPLLEMYQHACRELKNYIEEGRSIMREIEAETYEDNPPIFREYTMAAPAMRAQMDQQFKNIKIFARLQSRKQWYEWRAKLHQGLQEGLRKTLGDLEADRAALQARRAAVDAVYPALAAEHAALADERARLAAAVARLGGAGREALLAARGETRQLQQAVAGSRAAAAQLAAETAASKARVAAIKVEREEYLQALADARRLQEERRRWSHQEISSLRAQVDALEQKSGWAVTGAQGTTLSMAYRREVELVFDVAAFRPGRHANARIDLWYIGGAAAASERGDGAGAGAGDGSGKPPLAVEFFLQGIRDQARGLRQADTHPGALLRAVRASWDTARQALRQLRHLALAFPTATRRTSDQALAVDVSVLLAALRTKLAVTVHVRTGVDAGGGGTLQVAVSADVRVVYGEPFNAAKMGDFLSTRMAGGGGGGSGGSRAGKKPGGGAAAGEAWADVVEELKSKLLAQGCK